MANLACIGSRKVNGVAEVIHSFCHVTLSAETLQLHSELVKTTIMKDFVEFYGLSK
jgi:glucan phosphorylase